MAVRTRARAAYPRIPLDARPAVGQPSGPRAVVGFVCTANRCRSPLAEHLMRVGAAERGLSVDVFSMGLLQGGIPMPERGIATSAEFGLDLRRHRSTVLALDRLREADLVLGMSRHHVREVVSALPGLWPRAFTLKQFARFATGRAMPRRATLSSWLQVEAEDRSRGEMLGHNPADDVADPLRAAPVVWRSVIGEISTNVAQVLDACAPLLHPAVVGPPSRR